MVVIPDGGLLVLRIFNYEYPEPVASTGTLQRLHFKLEPWLCDFQGSPKRTYKVRTFKS